MREAGAELAGEMSGYFFFAELWYGFDDGIQAAARALEILALAEDPSALLKALVGNRSDAGTALSLMRPASSLKPHI